MADSLAAASKPITASRASAASPPIVVLPTGADRDARASAASLQYAQWYAGGLIWQVGTPDRPGTTGVLEIASRDGDRLVGALSATLFAGEDTIELTAELDLTPAYWTFPPERFCPGGKKPPG